jgi:transcriptional regulator with XRE-family HTH domain
MARPPKAAHVLARFRIEKLNWLQKVLADRCGLSDRTIQDIERGILKLSRRNAMRISAATGVDTQWLLDDNPSKPVLNVDGRKWSLKDLDRQKQWEQIGTEARRFELAPHYLLLQQYLQASDLIEGLPNAYKAARKWDEYFSEALGRFINEYAPARERVREWESAIEVQDDTPTPAEIAESETALFRSNAPIDGLKKAQDDINAMIEAYDQPARSDKAARDFWKALHSGLQLDELLKYNLAKPCKCFPRRC